MRFLKTFSSAILFVLLLFAIVGEMNAGITGKLAGRVIDKQTNEPLPGANITIIGTELGAATDIEGDYFILNIYPGTYQIKARMMGYQAVTIPNVKITVDRTTRINFELSQEVLDLGETVIVTADREKIQKDVAFTQHVMTSEVLTQTPTGARLEDALKSQVGIFGVEPGSVMGEQGILIRGDDEKEFTFMVDGMTLRDPRTRRPYTYVNKSSIQEVQIITGAFSAEYGDARSAIINVVTKENPKKYNLSFEGRYLPAMKKHFGPYIFGPENWWEVGKFLHDPQYDENGVPLPFYDQDQDSVADFRGWGDLTSDRWGGFFRHWTNPNTGEKIDMSVDGASKAFSAWSWQHRSPQLYEWIKNRPDSLLPGGREPYWVENYEEDEFDGVYENWNRYAYEPDFDYEVTMTGPLMPKKWGVPILSNTGFMASHSQKQQTYVGYSPVNYTVSTTQLKLSHLFKPGMKLMIAGIYGEEGGSTQYNEDNWEAGDMEATEMTTQEQYMRHYSPAYTFNRDSHLGIFKRFRNFASMRWTHQLNTSTYYTSSLSRTGTYYKTFPNPRHKDDEILYTVYVDPEVPEDSTKMIRLMDYSGTGGGRSTSDFFVYPDRQLFGWVHRSDYSKAERYSFKTDFTSQITKHHQLRFGIHALSTHVEHAVGGRTIVEAKTETENSGTYERNDVTTFQGAAYISDRMEFTGMIINAGLRLDVVRPDQRVFDVTDPFNPAFDKFAENPDSLAWSIFGKGEKPPVKWRLSPRLGISHPISDNSKIFFNYGHFYSVPDARHMYQTHFRETSGPVRLGNPWLDLPKTIQYETGLEQNIADMFRLTISGYYKSVLNDVTRLRVGGSSFPYNYSTYQNGRTRDIKGLEVQLIKPLQDHWRMMVSYNLTSSRSRGTGYHNIIDETRHEGEDTYSALTVTTFFAPRTYIVPTSHSVKLNFFAETPKHFGPRIGDFHPLSGFNLSFQYYWRLGLPFVMNPEHLASKFYQYSDRLKDYQMTDARIGKLFTIRGRTIEFFLEAKNLFNNKNMNVLLNAYGEIRTHSKEYATSIWRNLDEDTRAAEDAAIERYYNECKERGVPFGTDIGVPYMPKRAYNTYLHRREIWFGLSVYL
ncbi:TonB-dependent receptor [candidate division KSB1 bacterium]|nr:TonB-dependent receptor [candidate division KSB1 bacterium]